MERITPTIHDVVEDTLEFPAGIVNAVRALARAKPWRGSFDRRFRHLSRCLHAMSAVPPHGAKWQLVHVGVRTGCSGASRIDRKLKRVVLTGRPSVITMLHLFARACGADRASAIVWSATLFKRCFPVSFGRCRLVGGLIVNDGRRDD